MMTHALLVLAATARVLTLDEAVRTANEHQPQVRQAIANRVAAEARVEQARAPLLPQVTGLGSYRRSTSNCVQQPGSPPCGTVSMFGGAAAHDETDTFNFFNFSLTASQLIYDFGLSIDHWRAAQASAESQLQTERATGLLVVLGVRTTYFAARAQKALVQVAQETVASQDRHLAQIQGFVQVGTRPEIDLAQAKTDRANAEVQLINAENGYLTAKAQLNQAMGVEGTTDYEVADETLSEITGEEQPLDPLVDEAARARPDLVSLEEQLRAQRLTLHSIRGAYWPSLGFATTLSDAGNQIDDLGWNWNGTLTLTWNIFSGLQTRGQDREAQALVDALEAQRDGLRQQVRLEVEQARLAVRADKAALSAADTALENARLRLKLAEGRYQTGVGNIIELGDAQVALTNAAAQRVQAEYNLSTARAQLLKALARK
jgi:outer membrane protein